jgi:hypothetical protein
MCRQQTITTQSAQETKKTMKKRLFNSFGGRMAALVACGLLISLSAPADVILFDQTFDAPFGPSQGFAFGYFGGDINSSTYGVVTNAGTAGTSALVLSNTAAALGNGYGYAAAVYQETAVTGNTNANPAAYTLSFDARTSVANANGLEVRVIDGNGNTLDTAPNPPGYGNDRTLATTNIHFSLNLGDSSAFQTDTGFNPTTALWQILFQNNAGGGGNPPAWNVDIDNIQVTMAGTAPPPPPVTMYPPVNVLPGLNLYAGTEVNFFYDRDDVMSVQSSGLGWVGRATAINPVSYSFTVNSAPNSPQASFQMYLVPNLAANNSPDWFASADVVTSLTGNSTSAALQFGYKVNEAAGNSMQLGNAPYTNAPGSWNGVTSPYYESGALGSVTNTTGIVGTWTVKFTSDTNVTLIAPDGGSTNLVIPPYNASYLAESTSFNIYLSMQPEAQAAINQSFCYANFAVTGVVNPFSDNFLADATLNTNIWNSSVAISPADVFVSHGHQKLVTWSKPATGYSLQGAGPITGPWADLTQGPNPTLFGLFGQVVSSNELPAGNTAFLRLIHRTFTQLQVLFAGQTNAPGTLLGYVGSPTPTSVTGDSGLATVTINAVDPTFHIVSGISDSISFSATSDPDNTTLPTPPTFLVNGTLTTTVVIQQTGSFTVTVADTTSTNIASGTTPVPITVNP